jgi:transcriptional regulator with XRE-family HTH domain
MKKTSMTVVPLRTPARKRTFTTAEDLIEEVRTEIFRSGERYRVIAERTGVSNTTVSNLANGKTRWPRPTTLFPMLRSLKLALKMVRED